MTTRHHDSTETQLRHDELLRDTEVHADLVYRAARGERTTRVFPVNHEHCRTWVITGAEGRSVTYWDTGNGWCQILHVEMDERQREDFWRELRRLVMARPGSAHGIDSGTITDLMREAGFYSPGPTPQP